MVIIRKAHQASQVLRKAHQAEASRRIDVRYTKKSPRHDAAVKFYV